MDEQQELAPDTNVKFICPRCKGHLGRVAEQLVCEACGHTVSRNRFGYFDFSPVVYETFDSTTDSYATRQVTTGTRVYEKFLRPRFDKLPFRSVLDVGCGMGMGIQYLAKDGFSSFGLDMSNLGPYWKSQGVDPNHFVNGSCESLPFADNSFDIVYSLGVIEHVGTVDGHCTLRPDFWAIRERYATEILRVAKPGARIIIACPNKTCPIDIQHGAMDSHSRPTWGNRFRHWLFLKTGVHIHPTWGDNHLLSYADIRNLFQVGRASTLQALPLKGFFGFAGFKGGFLKPFLGLANAYVENIPVPVRETFLNPYMLVEIRKTA